MDNRLLVDGKIAKYPLAIYTILFITGYIHLCAFIFRPIKLMFVFLVIAVMLLNSSCKGIIKRMSTLDILYILTLIPFFMNNHDLKAGSYDNAIFQVCAIIVFLLLKSRCDWYEIFLRFIKFMSAFMVFWTVLFLIFPALKAVILPVLFPGNEDVLTTTAAIGLTHHYSANGNFMAIAVGAIFWFGNKNHKIRYWGFVAIAIICLLLTQKRGPLLWCAIALLITYYFYNSNNKSSRFFKLLVIFVACYAFINLASTFVPEINTVFERFQFEETSEGGVTFLSGREILYAAAWQLFLENPWTGVGWSGYAAASRSITGIEQMTAHNIYLSLLAETGVCGFIIFAMLYIIAILKGIQWLKRIRLERPEDENNGRILAFALFFIIYNATYGMSGLVLTDIMMVYVTMFSIALIRNYDYYGL